MRLSMQRFQRSNAVLLTAIVAFVSACGSAVTPQGDGGDVTNSDTAACGSQPTEGCAFGTAGGACGDAEVPQVCENGAWHCPSGSIPRNQCRCFGRPPGNCTCTATGWQCTVDAGVDAPSECPTDPTAANGTPCSEEGRVCGGPCTDRCQWCNVVRCEGGRWNALEISPDPRCNSTFACGSMQCGLLTQYCYVVLDDTGGPNFYECRPLPDACNGTATCACVTGSPAWGTCGQTSDGAVTVTTGGG